MPDRPAPAIAPPPVDDDPPITEPEAEAYLAKACRPTGSAGRVGVELEWLVYDQNDPARPVPAGAVPLGAIPLANGHLTHEPGGQIEYSSYPARDLDSCLANTRRDMTALRAEVGAAGYRLAGFGMDPVRPPRRALDLPRYVAMEEFLNRGGAAGRWMMGTSASVQVCLDSREGADTGADTSPASLRWRLAHAIGPVLVAMFANSPILHLRPTGWLSTRQGVWRLMDRTRTAPVISGSPTAAGDATDDWIRYALGARVMFIRHNSGRQWTVPRGLTFRDWLRQGGRRPTLDDLVYHVSTLFPPVRPRGYLELRMIDAQPADGWTVPLTLASALLDDPTASDVALAAIEPIWSRSAADDPPWTRAARLGLADPAIAAAAIACFRAAALATPPGPARTALEDFGDRYVERSRCPAHDLLDRHRRALTALVA